MSAQERTGAHGAAERGDPAELPKVVLWHDLECGSYTADLRLWRELALQAAPAGGPETVLDIGAGSGRVSIDLARRGHRVRALELDPDLLAALTRRGRGLSVDGVLADARSFSLPDREHALCIVPMQTLQLLGGSDARAAFFACARAHLRDGGLLACAIVTELEPFDVRHGGAPEPEVAEVHGRRFQSRAIRMRVQERQIVIERERRVIGANGREQRRLRERDIVALDRVDGAMLRAEGQAAGLKPAGERLIAATSEHVASVVVLFDA